MLAVNIFMRMNTAQMFKTILIIITLVTAAFSVWYLIFHQHDKYIMRCSSISTSMSNTGNGIISFGFRLENNGKGHIIFTGELWDKQGKTYHISKDIKFNYSLEPDSSIITSGYKVIQGATDNIPMVVFNQRIFDISTPARHFYIEKHQNMYLFSNTFSLFKVCIDKTQLNHVP